MERFLPYFALGLALIAIGVLSLVKGKKKRSRCTASAIATITDVAETLDIRTDNAGEARRYKYTPTYSYQVNGQSFAFRGVYAYDNKKKFRVGDTAQLYYDPANPQDATTQAAAGGKSKAGVVLIILGIAACVLACTQL